MAMLALPALALLAFAIACTERPAPSPSPASPSATATAAPTVAPSAPAAPPEGAPIACASDAECSPPACGPCTPGAVIERGGPECYVNPCLNPSAVCGPNHVCVIGPKTRPNPAIFRDAAPAR